MKAAIQEDLDAARQEAAKQVAEAKARASAREQELMAAAKVEAERERVRARCERVPCFEQGTPRQVVGQFAGHRGCYRSVRRAGQATMLARGLRACAISCLRYGQRSAGPRGSTAGSMQARYARWQWTRRS